MAAGSVRIALAYIALCLFWGSSWAATSAVVTQVPPLRAISMRFALAVGVLVPVIVLRRLPLPRGRALGANMILGFSMVAVPYALLFWGGQRVGSGMIAVLFATMPLIAALLAPLLHGNEVPRRAFYATLGGVGGIALLVSGALSVSLAQAAGAGAVLLAVLSTAASLFYARRELASTHPIASTAVQLAVGAVPFFLLSLATERQIPAAWNPDSLGAMSFLVIAGSAIAFPLYYWLLQRLEPYQVAAIEWVQPVVAVLEGAWFLRERLGWSMIAGTVVVLVSLAMVLGARVEDEQTLTIG
jgi:drug/metabolite transporter (DMT)-like permease